MSRGLKLEGEFKSRTNHHPQEPYYRLPFADDVIYLAGFFRSGLSYIYEDQAAPEALKSMDGRIYLLANRPQSGSTMPKARRTDI